MGRAVKLPLARSPLEYILDLIESHPEDYLLVFPGKRPVYFLKKLLALRKKRAYFPPKAFPVEAFVREIHREYFGNFREPSVLQAVWMAYETGREMGLPNFSSFASSFFWAMKFYEAVEELEKEMVEGKKLRLSTEFPALELSVVEEMMGRLAEFRERFLERLRREGMRTSGMIYREAAEAVAEGGIPWKEKIILGGLSALTASERLIFRKVMEREEALFVYQEVEEAEGIHDYLKEWGLEVEEADGDAPSPAISLHTASGVHGQVLALQQVLKELPPQDTVVVLPDPSILLPVLSQGLSSYPHEYNVSVGYPMARTPVYALLERMMELQNTAREGDERLYHAGKYLELVLHPYIKNLRFNGDSETSRRILHALEDALIESRKPFLTLKEIEESQMDTGEIPLELAREHVRKINDLFVRSLEGAKNLREIAGAMIEALKEIWRRSPARFYPLASPFFRRFLSFLEGIRELELAWEPLSSAEAFSVIKHALLYERVPFEGTPLRELQLLGQLETRALRFKNVVYLSANEDYLPATEPIDPLLPTAVREYLGLPTFRDRERIIKYYFFRLLRGAEKVHIIYDSSEKSTRSRFVEELVWEEEKKGKNLEVKTYSPLILENSREIEIGKNPGILRELQEREFSPSSIDAYMECPMKFYLLKVLGLEEREEIEEEPEMRKVGTLLHEVLEEFYRPLIGRQVKEEDLDTGRLKGIIQRKFAEFFPWDMGEVALLKVAMEERLGKFLEWEKRQLPFEVLYLEAEFAGKIDLDGRKISVKGKLDRVQRRGGKIEVIDYKLSSGKTPKKNLEGAMEERKEMAKNIKSFQLPIYLYLLKQKGLIEDYSQSQAYFYPMGFKTGGEFKPKTLGVEELPALMQEVFLPSLKNLISEILNPDIPFTASPSNPDVCDYCPFRPLCGK